MSKNPIFPPIDNSSEPKSAAIIAQNALQPSSSFNSSKHECFGMNLCATCHQYLLHAFDHCVQSNLIGKATSGGQIESGMTSVLEMDEEADALELTGPPEFELVDDNSIQATKTSNTMLVSGKTVCKKEKLVEEKKEISLKEETQNNLLEQMEQKLFSKFSGNVYKAVLQQKNSLIQRLKQQLFEKSLNEKLEQSNVNKLQKALGKAVGFYSFAQDWKDQECRRLQHDIVLLKTYLSTLMACIIDAELEKQKIVIEMNRVQQALVTKDERIQEEQSKIGEIQDKLHQVYKDYVFLNEEHEDLKKNSTSAKEIRLTQQKLDTVTQQYRTISDDFVATTKQLDQQNLKRKQLEFELSELVRQFNLQGAENKSLKSDYTSLNAKYKSLLGELSESKEAHLKTIQERNVLEADLKKLETDHERLKNTNEREIAGMNEQLTAQKTRSASLEEDLGKTREELEAAKATIAQQKQHQTQISQEANKIQLQLKGTIKDRDTRISTLTSSLDEAEKQVRMLKDQKDQLMIKSNELKIDLDSEVNQVRTITLDFKLYKHDMEERFETFTREMRVLTAARDALVLDARKMMDDIKDLKFALKKKEKDLQGFQEKFDEQKELWDTKEDILTSEIENLKESIGLLTSKLNRTIQDHNKASEQVTRLKAHSSVLQEDLKILTEQHEIATHRVQVLTRENQELSLSYSECREKLQANEAQLSSTMEKFKNLEQETRLKKLETDDQIRSQRLNIKELEVSCKTNFERLNLTMDELRSYKETLSKTKKELEKIGQLYEEEKKMKERTECYLTMAYDDLMAEKRMRIEIEKIMYSRQQQIENYEYRISKFTEDSSRKNNMLQSKVQAEYQRLQSFMKTI